MLATTTFIQPMNNSNYYMNPQTGPSPPESYNSTTPPSNNISPTNYHANVKQLRQPRQPLYIPAALRRTDKTTRPTDIPRRIHAPDTPPASQDSSFDSGRVDSPAAIEFGYGSIEYGQVDNYPESVRRLDSNSTSASGHDLASGEVTGTPTTAHWKPDESSNNCFVCNETFTWFFRRHHCRRCGNLVCDNHIKWSVPLDQNARYHLKGTPSKACRPCYNGFKDVAKGFHSRAGSIAESSNSSQGTAMPIPNLGRGDDNMRVGSMARSEGGMVWSTF